MNCNFEVVSLYNSFSLETGKKRHIRMRDINAVIDKTKKGYPFYQNALNMSLKVTLCE